VCDAPLGRPGGGADRWPRIAAAARAVPTHWRQPFTSRRPRRAAAFGSSGLRRALAIEEPPNRATCERPAARSISSSAGDRRPLGAPFARGPAGHSRGRPARRQGRSGLTPAGSRDFYGSVRSLVGGCSDSRADVFAEGGVHLATTPDGGTPRPGPPALVPECRNLMAWLVGERCRCSGREIQPLNTGHREECARTMLSESSRETELD